MNLFEMVTIFRAKYNKNNNNSNMHIYNSLKKYPSNGKNNYHYTLV